MASVEELLGAKPQAGTPTIDSLLGPRKDPAQEVVGLDGFTTIIGGEPVDLEKSARYKADSEDLMAERMPGAELLDAVGMGISAGWGTDPLGLSDQTVKQLQDLGIYPDYQSRWKDPIKAFVSTPMRALAYGGDLAARVIRSTYYGIANGIGVTAEGAGLSQGDARRLTRDIVGLAESALTVAGAAPFKPGPTIGQLRRQGAVEAFDTTIPFRPGSAMSFEGQQLPFRPQMPISMQPFEPSLPFTALAEEGALARAAAERAVGPAPAVAARSAVAEPAVPAGPPRNNVPFDRQGVAIQPFDPQAPIQLPSGTFWRPPKIDPLTGRLLPVRQRAAAVVEDAAPAARTAAADAAVATPEPAPVLRPGVDFENVPMKRADAPEQGVTPQQAAMNSDTPGITAAAVDDPATTARAPLVDKAGNINLKYYADDPNVDFKQRIRETAEDPNFQQSTLRQNGPVTWEQVDELSSAFGMNPKQVARDAAENGMQAHHIDAWRKWLEQTSRETANLEAAIARGAVDDATLIRYQAARLEQYAAQKAVSDAATTSGRNLNIFKKMIKKADEMPDVPDLLQILGC